MSRIPAEESSDPQAIANDPVVSVLMMTRNHEPYLREAVESVASQECDFPVEILIGEDCSTDTTRTVASALQVEHPYLVRLITADRNVGILDNFLRLIARAKGPYVAMLEGDDYWTNTKKLQRQVDLLRAHPEFALCATRTRNRTFWAKPKLSYTLSEILRRYIFHTSSLLFRRSLIERFPDCSEIVCLDNVLFACLTEQGECGFLDEEMSYYRRHPGGIWSGTSPVDRMKTTADCIDFMDRYFKGRYARELADRELWIYTMEFNITLGPGYWSRWRSGLKMIVYSARRLLGRYPLGWLKLALRIIFQPAAAAYRLFRRKLALRRRLSTVKGRFIKSDRYAK